MFGVGSLRIEKFHSFTAMYEQFILKTTTFCQSSLSIQVLYIFLFHLKTFAIKESSYLPSYCMRKHQEKDFYLLS